MPFIKVKRQHSSYVFELILIPFIDLKKAENIDPKPKSNCKPQNRCDSDSDCNIAQQSEDAGMSQQQLIATIKQCELAGIKYQSEDLPKIACHGIEAVKKAVDLFRIRSLTSEIKNPCGWLRSCLKIESLRIINKILEIQVKWSESSVSVPENPLNIEPIDPKLMEYLWNGEEKAPKLIDGFECKDVKRLQEELTQLKNDRPLAKNYLKKRIAQLTKNYFFALLF